MLGLCEVGIVVQIQEYLEWPHPQLVHWRVLVHVGPPMTTSLFGFWLLSWLLGRSVK